MYFKGHLVVVRINPRLSTPAVPGRTSHGANPFVRTENRTCAQMLYGNCCLLCVCASDSKDHNSRAWKGHPFSNVVNQLDFNKTKQNTEAIHFPVCTSMCNLCSLCKTFASGFFCPFIEVLSPSS